MPVTFDENLYRSLYSHPFDPEANRNRAERHASLIANLVTGSVVVVGCGLGWLVAVLTERGHDVVGVDASPFVADRPDLCPVPVMTAVVDASVDVGRRFDVAIDEDAAPAHPDVELDGFFAGCERLADRVVHLVSTGTRGDSSQNWKPLDQWARLAPHHVWVDAASGEVA